MKRRLFSALKRPHFSKNHDLRAHRSINRRRAYIRAHAASSGTLHRHKHIRIFSPRILIGAAVLVAVLVLVLLFGLTNNSRLMNTAELSGIRNRGVLRVGILEDMPGFSEDGEGFEVELARLLAREVFEEGDIEMVLQLTFVTGKSARAHLQKGDIDIALAQLSDDGSSSYVYSKAYYQEPCVLVTKAAHQHTALKGQFIGAIKSSAAYTCTTKYLADNAPDATIKLSASYPDMIAALSRGEILAAAMPASAAKQYLSSGYVAHDISCGNIAYRAAVYSEQESLAILFDTMLDNLKADGSLDDLLARYGL